MGGTGAGTPGAYAESLYRSQVAPQAAMQIGQLQNQFLQPLLQAMFGLSQRGIPQAVEAVSPSPFSQITGAITGAAAGAAPIMRALGVGTPSPDFTSFLGSLPPVDASGIPAFDPNMLMTAMRGNYTQSGYGGSY